MNGSLHDELASARVRALLEEGIQGRLSSAGRPATLGVRGRIGSFLVSLGSWVGGCELRSFTLSSRVR